MVTGSAKQQAVRMFRLVHRSIEMVAEPSEDESESDSEKTQLDVLAVDAIREKYYVPLLQQPQEEPYLRDMYRDFDKY